MSEYRWVPDLVCHGMCPQDANLHALEVPGDRIIVFTAATCPHCRAEKAERERDEARPVLEAAREQVKQSKRWSGGHGHDDYLMAAYHTEQAVAAHDAARAAAKEVGDE